MFDPYIVQILELLQFLGCLKFLGFMVNDLFLQEICTLYLAAKVNGDKMNLVNGLGLVVALSGITLHVILKAVHSKYSPPCIIITSLLTASALGGVTQMSKVPSVNLSVHLGIFMSLVQALKESLIITYVTIFIHNSWTSNFEWHLTLLTCNVQQHGI